METTGFSEPHDLLIKTDLIVKGYYMQGVPWPSEDDKVCRLKSLSENIAKDFKDASLERLMRNIHLIASYLPKFLGSFDEYYSEKMNKKDLCGVYGGLYTQVIE